MNPVADADDEVDPQWHRLYGVVTADTQKICRTGEHVEVLCGADVIKIRAMDDHRKCYHYDVQWEQVMSSVEAGTGEGPEAEPMLYLVMVLDQRKVVEVTMRLLQHVRVLMGTHEIETELDADAVLQALPIPPTTLYCAL